MKRMMAVASGKGGVGKSWFSISIGHALVRMNRRVLLVDCDLGLANIDVQLGLGRAADLIHVAMGEVPFSQAIRTVDAIGLDVLPGRSGGGYPGGLDPLTVGWLQGELRSICNDYDAVILDLPSGIEHGVRELMRHADEEIVVTTGEPTALTDAYALIKATRANRPESVPRIVVNFADDVAAGQQTLEGLTRVCNRFLGVKPSGIGIVRRDKRVAEAIARQTSLLACFPGCNAARDIVVTAEAILALRDPV